MKTIDQPTVLAELTTRLRALRPDTASRWGVMTANEMLCHLGDASASVLRGGREPGPRRYLYKWIALYSPLRWPRGLRTPASVDPRRDGTRPADFERDRTRAIAGLRALAAATPDALPASHSRFGRMTARDWRRWAFRHTEHHLRQFGL